MQTPSSPLTPRPLTVSNLFLRKVESSAGVYWFDIHRVFSTNKRKSATFMTIPRLGFAYSLQLYLLRLTASLHLSVREKLCARGNKRVARHRPVHTIQRHNHS